MFYYYCYKDILLLVSGLGSSRWIIADLLFFTSSSLHVLEKFSAIVSLFVSAVVDLVGLDSMSPNRYDSSIKIEVVGLPPPVRSFCKVFLP